MSEYISGYDVIETDGVPIKTWTRGVPLEDKAEGQLRNVAALPFVHDHVAAMPDVHWGMGATVGSVIPLKGAIIPAAVGVDIGCGMMAVQTSLTSHQLPEDLSELRSAIEQAVPHGRTSHRPATDKGSWTEVPEDVAGTWAERPYRRGSLATGLAEIVNKHPKLGKANSVHHLGTLGTGNHFIEVCLDEADRVWVMLHSGSRGIGNRIGSYFIGLAKQEMERWFIHLPDADLAYLPEGTEHFYDYVRAVSWAQAFARTNRELMMDRLLEVMARAFMDFAPRRDGRELSSQLRGPGEALRRQGLGDPEGRGARRRGRARHHSRQHGGAFPSSCAAKGTRTPSIRARTGPGGRCRGTRPSGASPSRTTPVRPRASSAARTPGSSTKHRWPTRTSTPSWPRRQT